jgi:hypothetical protein
MSAEEYVILSCAALAALFILGASRARAPEEPEPPPPDPGRWRRFRIHDGSLRGPLDEAAPAVVEEPSGLRLDAAPRHGAADPVRVAAAGGTPKVTVTRGWLFPGRLRVRIDGRPAIALASARGRVTVRSLAGEPIEARGDLRAGDYEIRRGGKLVAMSFQESGPEGSPTAPARHVEVLRGDDPVLPLALAMALEVARSS